jgi:hypothetical protein
VKRKKYFVDLAKKFSPRLGNNNYKKHLSRQNNKAAGFFNIMSFIKNRDNSLNKVFVIPLGQLKIPKKLEDKRKKNWLQNLPSIEKSQIATYNRGRYSSQCSWTRYEYRKIIESWGYLVSNKNLFMQIDTEDGIKRKIVKAPKGWYWKYDDTGLGIYGPNGENYHPSAEELLNKKQKEYLDIARQNFKIYKKEKVKLKECSSLLKLMSKQKNYIYLGDSLSVGNCYNGTKTFAKNILGIDRNYIEADKISLNCHKSIPLIVKKAYYRQQKEFSQGFCSIPYMKGEFSENHQTD